MPKREYPRLSQSANPTTSNLYQLHYQFYARSLFPHLCWCFIINMLKEDLLKVVPSSRLKAWSKKQQKILPIFTPDFCVCSFIVVTCSTSKETLTDYLVVHWQLDQHRNSSSDSTSSCNLRSFSHFALNKKLCGCNDFSMHKYCPFLEGEISSWPAFRPENSLKRCFTVLRCMSQKYFLSGNRNLCIIFI